MDRFHQVMAGQFRNIEASFEIESSISEFPIHFSSAGDPRFSSIVIHSSEGIGNYGI